jgi:hypothetical protein
MRTRSALSVAVAVAAVAVAAAGPVHGFVAGDGNSTADVQPDEGTPGTAPGGTADLQPEEGAKPPKTAPEGSTADQAPPASGPTTVVVDTTDLGVKNLPVTEDLGTKDLPAGQDLGDR